MRKTLLVAALAATAAACTSWVPPGPMPGSVANTSWRVAAINGRATPPVGDFFMNFQASTFGAKFGCNGIGADYVQRGFTIDPGPTTGTLMACPDMSFESQGNAVLQRDMRTIWNGPANLRLVNSNGTIDLRR